MDNNNQPSTSGYSEEGRGCRLKRKQIDPIVCPICGVTLRSTEVEAHLTSEIEKLNKIQSSKMKSNSKNTPSSSTSNGATPKSPNVSDKDKNWETYQKIKTNRQTRQKTKSRKRKNEEVTCPICYKDISPAVEDLMIHVELCLRRSESSNENEEESSETIDVEAFEEYEWAGQSRIRVTSLLPGGVSDLGSSLNLSEDDEVNVEVVDDYQSYGEAQYSECDVILPCEDEDNHELRKAVIGSNSNIPVIELSSGSEESSICGETSNGFDPTVEVLKARIRELESRVNSKEDTYRCLICMDRYRTPVISVCCWHVHCEQCWLKTLGAKKLCPQCNMITSPNDLRKIYI